jgi:hypothetical protein
MAGARWFLFRKFCGEIWQLLVEGEVEQDGASPSVILERALTAIGGFCNPWGWFIGKDCVCISAAVEKLLLPSGC